MFQKNKKILFLFSLLLFMTASVAFAQMWKEGRSDVCGGSDLVHFTLADADRTQFAIPEPYSDDIMKMHNEGPSQSISMNIKLEDFDANCKDERQESNKARTYIYTSVRPSEPDQLSRLSNIQKIFYPQGIAQEGDFSVFRSKDYILGAPLNGEDEILIPKDQKLKDKYFLKCSRRRDSEKIVGCTVTQHIIKGIYAHYVIDESQIKNLGKLIPKMDQKIISFIKD